MTDYVASVDGGGTKTLGAYASQDGHVQFTTVTAGCNPQDNPQWRDGLSQVLAQFPPVQHAVLGLPGYGEVPALDQMAHSFVSEVFTSIASHKALVCMNDVEMAFRGAFPKGNGVLVLSGTGSMAMAQGQHGVVRAGGWGDLFGDEGSAFWIGRRGLQLASQMRDGRIADTGFADRLSEKLNIPLSDGFFGFSVWAAKSTHPRSSIAKLSIYINALSDEADLTARSILDAAADELVSHVRTVARVAQSAAPLRWTHGGAVFRSARVLDQVTKLLGGPPVRPEFDALGGGLWLAAIAAGWPVDAAWAARVRSGLGQKVTA
jgi:glucosamine kinase